jgi:hypothetical protein
MPPALADRMTAAILAHIHRHQDAWARARAHMAAMQQANQFIPDRSTP